MTRDFFVTAEDWGPILCLAGGVVLAGAAVVHGWLGWPTILSRDDGAADRPPSLAERVSVHLVIYGVWAVGFGAAVWRGVPADTIDTRMPFERAWPVFEPAEWIYLSAYLVPMLMPWVVNSRAALRRYSVNVGWLLALSLACFWLLPLAAPAREFTPTSLAGRILAWETSRPGFAAAALPSFHVFWALLCASLLASRGTAWARAGWTWAAAVAVSCVANGAHALADVGASLVIYAVLVRRQSRHASVDARRPEARPAAKPTSAPTRSAPSP
jgi:hypothetical protein